MTQELPDEWAQAMIAAGCVDPRRKATVASMTQLAARSGLTTETVRRMIYGLGVADHRNVQAVADVLGAQVFTWVLRSRANRNPWSAPDEAAFLSDEEGETLTRLIRQMTAHRRRPERPVETAPQSADELAGRRGRTSGDAPTLTDQAARRRKKDDDPDGRPS